MIIFLPKQIMGSILGQGVPGGGKFRSAASAKLKCAGLKVVLQRYFHDTTEYDGSSEIDEDDSKTAIKFVISQKDKKLRRQTAQGAVVFAATVAGAATGATLGSIVPVAGNILGGLVGGVTTGNIASGALFLLDRAVRGLKAVRKPHRGERRKQAAQALYRCALTRGNNYSVAADEALKIILEWEYEIVMETRTSDRAIERIMARIKSV